MLLPERGLERFLVDEHGALPELRNLDGSTAIHVCAKEKDPLGWENINEVLLWHEELGHDPIEHANARTASGVTPMMVAARQPRDGAAKVLLEWRADPNLQDEDGNSALHHTEELIDNMGPILKALVDGKADVDLLNARGLKPQLPMTQECPMQ